MSKKRSMIIIFVAFLLPMALFAAEERHPAVADLLKKNQDDYKTMQNLLPAITEQPATPEIPAEQTYVIELEKFGIKPGFFEQEIDSNGNKSYSDAAYKTAYNNILGMNAAIEHGVKQGAKKIVLPRNQYSFCYANVSDDQKKNRIVIDYDNLIVDFDGSTWKAVFDSEKRSPYDQYKPVSHEPNFVLNDKTKPYQFSGIFIVIGDCKNTTLRNGTIIGDRISRSFKEQNEKAMEQTYAIAAGRNTDNIVIEKFDISFFMGDAICVGGGYKNKHVMVGFNMKWAKGALRADGSFDDSQPCAVSMEIPVTPGETYFMWGYAYTQGFTAIKRKAYNVAMYDADKKFLGAFPDVKPLRSFVPVKGTAFVRLQVDEAEIPKDGWQMVLIHGSSGSRLTCRDNVIHHNHRGGLQPGVNDMLIIRNRFYNNGELRDEEYNLPGFEQPSGIPFMTRYHINMEDTQAHNIHILDNQFENGRMGVAARGTEFYIAGNKFTNCGVTLYRLQNLVLRNNQFINGWLNTFPYDDTGGFKRNWIIDGNDFDGAVSISGNAPVQAFLNNNFKHGFSSAAPVEEYKNNTHNLEVFKQYAILVNLDNVKRIENCTFVKSPDSTVNSTMSIGSDKNKISHIIRNSHFANIKVIANNALFENCKMADTSFAFNTELTFQNCKFTQGDQKLRNDYAAHPDNSAMFLIGEDTKKLTLKNCVIDSTGNNPIFSSQLNAKRNADVEIANSKISKSGSGKTGEAILTGTLKITDSEVPESLKKEGS